MNIRKSRFVIAVALLTIIPFLPAQQAPAPPPPPIPSAPPKTADVSKPEAFYRLDFAIREMEGDKLVDTRNYSLWVRAGHAESMKAGSEVPYSNSQGNTSYRSTGVSIACTLKETDGSPWLSVNMDISGLAPVEKGAAPSAPVFRSTSIGADAFLTLGKPTTVSSVDDPATKRRLVVDVTAIKLKQLIGDGPR
jgi:hypothetical protein